MTTDDLYLIIGVKEAELISLRQQNQKLQAELNGWQAEAQRLQAALRNAKSGDDGYEFSNADTAILHRP